MIEMTVICRTCGTEWQPDHSDYVRGRWRQCLACRDGPDASGIRSHVTPIQERTGERRASESGATAQNERK